MTLLQMPLALEEKIRTGKIKITANLETFRELRTVVRQCCQAARMHESSAPE